VQRWLAAPITLRDTPACSKLSPRVLLFPLPAPSPLPRQRGATLAPLEPVPITDNISPERASQVGHGAPSLSQAVLCPSPCQRFSLQQRHMTAWVVTLAHLRHIPCSSTLLPLELVSDPRRRLLTRLTVRLSGAATAWQTPPPANSPQCARPLRLSAPSRVRLNRCWAVDCRHYTC
jgi:hypothetical protein